jgi:tripartite-type tricarboxylate transporter receptor subunit TctC
MAAVIAGEASFMFIEIIVGLPFVNAGKLKLLAVATPKRIAALPDTPTLSEASFPGYDPTGWAALFVPTSTSRLIIDKLNAQVKDILKLPDVQKVLANGGTEFSKNTPEYVSVFLKSEIAKWGNAVKISGVRAE